MTIATRSHHRAASTPYMRGLRAGTRGPSRAPTRPRSLPVASLPTQEVCAPASARVRPSASAAPSPPLFAHFASGTRPQRFACVLRPLGAARPPPLDGPRVSGRRFLARPLCALTRSVGSRWPRLPLGPASRRCGLPSGRPCCALPWPLCSAWPRGFLSPRPSGLRGLASSLRFSAGAPARGRTAAMGGLFPASRPRALGCARPRVRLLGALWVVLR